MAGPAAIITQWVGYSRRTVGVMERGCQLLLVLPPTDIRTSHGRCCVPTFFRCTHVLACVFKNLCQKPKLSYVRIIGTTSSSLYSPIQPLFFFWRILFQNFIIEKKRDCYGFFVMQLIKLATSRSGHFLGRHLQQQFCKNVTAHLGQSPFNGN